MSVITTLLINIQTLWGIYKYKYHGYRDRRWSSITWQECETSNLYNLLILKFYWLNCSCCCKGSSMININSENWPIQGYEQEYKLSLFCDLTSLTYAFPCTNPLVNCSILIEEILGALMWTPSQCKSSLFNCIYIHSRNEMSIKI